MRIPILGSHATPSRSHMNLETDREYRTCLCVHVRTGTLLLGLLHMLLQVVVILATLLLIVRPNAWQEARQRYQFVDSALHMFPFTDSNNNHNHAGLTDPHDAPDVAALKATTEDKGRLSLDPEKWEMARSNIDMLPDRGVMQANTLSTVRPPVRDSIQSAATADKPSEAVQKRELSKRGDRLWTVSLTALFLFFTGLLVHGVLYRRPAHLLPYFSLQVFDFVLSCLTVMGYMTYLPDAKNRDLTTDGGDTRQSLFSQSGADGSSGGGQDARSMAMNMHYHNWERVDAGTRLAYMSLAFLVLGLKAYLMGMVWACYKYLIMWHRLNATTGSLSAPTDLREALHDMWAHMRRPVSGVMFTWLPGGVRRANVPARNGEGRGLLSTGGEDEEATTHLVLESDAEAQLEQPPTEPPNYEDLLKQPANANMPPPYFKAGNSSEVEATSETKK